MGDLPLSGPPSRVLCGVMGIDAVTGEGITDPWYVALTGYFRTANLLSEYPVRWPRLEAARAASLILASRGPTVLLGRRVAEAGGHGSAAYFDWQPGDVVVVPHPSGMNRLLNDPNIRKAIGDTLWEAVRRANA